MCPAARCSDGSTAPLDGSSDMPESPVNCLRRVRISKSSHAAVSAMSGSMLQRSRTSDESQRLPPEETTRLSRTRRLD